MFVPSLFNSTAEPARTLRTVDQRCTVARQRGIVVVCGILGNSFQLALDFPVIGVDRQAPDVGTHRPADEDHPTVRSQRGGCFVRRAERRALRRSADPTRR